MFDRFLDWCDRFAWWVRLFSILACLAFLIALACLHAEFGAPAPWVKWTLVAVIFLVTLRVAVHRSIK